MSIVGLLAMQLAMPDRATLEVGARVDKARVAKVQHLLSVARPLALSAFEGCAHTLPRLTGIDWYTVNWDGPAGASVPSNGTAFKFRPHSDEVVKIEATNTPVIVKVEPRG